MSANSRAVVALKWKFSPSNFFGVAIERSNKDYSLAIENGQVQAKIDFAIYNRNPQIRQKIQVDLDGRFLVMQFLTHRAYDLSKSTMTHLRPDGRVESFFELETGRIKVTGGTLDFRTTDKYKNIIFDPKQDQVDRRIKLLELAAAHYVEDAVLVSLLQSYDKAVRDPNNEFVYLFEIYESLCKKLGGKHKTLLALNISAKKWEDLRIICNHSAIRQGRHRGQACGVLRDATKKELTEARSIVTSMIEAYLLYLDTITKTKQPLAS